MAKISEIQVKEIPELTVACVSHVGPYWELMEAFEKLFSWLSKNDVQAQSPAMGFYYDNPKEVPMDKLRSDAAAAVPEDTQTGNDVNVKKISPMKVVSLIYTGSYADQAKFKAYGKLINYIEENGMELSSALPLIEIYLNSPAEVDESELETEIQMPVK